MTRLHKIPNDALLVMYWPNMERSQSETEENKTMSKTEDIFEFGTCYFLRINKYQLGLEEL